MNVTARHQFEIELALTGTFQPGYAATGPSYSSGGEPRQPDMIEDLDVADIGVIVAGHDEQHRINWTTHSILNGIDRTSPFYARLVENIMKIVGEDAEQVLLGEVE